MRRVGVEIEFLSPVGETEIVQALRNAGVDAEGSRYHGARAGGGWVLKPDGSLNVGTARGMRHTFELVSPPTATDAAGLENIRVAVDVLSQLGCTVNRTCGLHVHVDAGDLTVRDMKRVAKRYAAFETEIDRLHPESRRANQYCNRLNGWASWPESDFDNAPAAEHWSDAVRTFVSHLHRTGHGWSSRYHKVNLTSFLVHRTVEFRQHSGTVEPAKVLAWVRFCVAFVESSRYRPAAGTDGMGNVAPGQDSRKTCGELRRLLEAVGCSTAIGRDGASTQLFISSGGRAAVLDMPTINATLYRRGFVDRSALATWLASTFGAMGQATDSLWQGIPPDVRQYMEERAVRLARTEGNRRAA